MASLARGNDGIVFRISSDNAGALRGINEVSRALAGLRDRAESTRNALLDLSDLPLTALMGGVSALQVALTGVAAKAVAAGSAFESKMTRVAAISGATGEELESLTVKSRQLGRDLPISATDAAAAMENMAQRGWSVRDMLLSVGSVVNLSISQQYGLAESADLVGAAMTNFKLSAGMASEVVDIFNSAANQSALDMNKLGFALKYVASYAAAAGMNLKQTMAMLEALGDAGMTGETMGTGLRTVLVRLAEAATAGGAAFRKLGVSVTDATGKMRDPIRILQDLGRAGMDLAAAQRLFGTEAGAAGLMIARAGDKLDDYMRGLDQTGSTAANVARQLDTVGVAFDNLKSSLEDMEIEAFYQVRRGIVSLSGSIEDLVKAGIEWMHETGAIDAAVRSFAAGLGISVTSAAEFRAALESIDMDRWQTEFQNLGSMVGTFVRVLGLLEKVPWDWIIRNFESLVVLFGALWIGGKVLGAASAIAGFAASLSLLGTSLAAAGVSLGAFTLALGPLGLVAALAVAGVAAAEFLSDLRDASAASDVCKEAVGQLVTELSDLGGDELDRRLKILKTRLEEVREAAQNFGPNPSIRDRKSPEEVRLERTIEKLEKAKDLRREIDEAKEVGDILPKANEVLYQELAAKKLRNAYDREEIDLIRAKDEARRKTWELAGALGPDAAYNANIQGALGSLDRMQEQAVLAQKRFSLSWKETGEILGREMAATVQKVAGELEKASAGESGETNPFLAEGFKRAVVARFRESGWAANEMGDAAKTAFEKIVLGAKDAKTAVERLREELSGLTDPMRDISEAVKGGFLKGPELQEALRFLQSSSLRVGQLSEAQIREQYGKLGLSEGVMKGLAASRTTQTLEGVGLTRSGGGMPSASGNLPGNFVRNVNAPVTIQIGNVQVGRPEDARKTGLALGQGMAQSFEMRQ